MPKTINILVVEDEEPISLLIKYNLEKEGFNIHQAFDGAEALDKADEIVPDLILLDWMLPEMNGIEVAKEIRSFEFTKKIPIIMLTARSQEEDKLKGFEVGADDYITKPFSPKELVARVKSVLKRTKPEIFETEISFGSLKVDNNRKSILAEGKALDLSPTEYYLMSYMIQKPEKVHSRDRLLRNVWQDEEVEGRAVDVCIRRLRAALDKVRPGLSDMIKTVRGEGYILETS
jgi:two-component system phosphate regulon response regulator PhoB